MKCGLAVVALLGLLGFSVAGEEPVEVRERLPFLPADGADRPGATRVPWLLPEWEPGPVRDVDEDEDPDSPAPDPDRWYPGVSKLLEGLPGEMAYEDEDPEIVYRGPPEGAGRLRRLLAAVRAGLARRVHLEIEIRGPVSCRLKGEIPEGALLFDDTRTEHAYPAALCSETKAASPSFVRVRTGCVVAATAVTAGEGRWIVRLSLQVSRITGERRFEGAGPTLVAPVTSFATVTADVPAVAGRWTVLESRLPGEEPGLVVAVKVEPGPGTPPPAGTRVYPVQALSPLFEPLSVPAYGPCELMSRNSWEDGGGARAEPLRPEIPPAWLEAAGRDIRLAPVSPGLVVAEGPEYRLVEMDACLASWWRREFRAVTLARGDSGGPWRLSLPLVPRHRACILQGRVTPVAAETEVEICQPIAHGATVVRGLFTGRRLVIRPGEGGVLRLDESRSPTPALKSRPIRIDRTDQDGRVTETLPFDVLDLRVDRRREILEVGSDRLPLRGWSR